MTASLNEFPRSSLTLSYLLRIHLARFDRMCQRRTLRHADGIGSLSEPFEENGRGVFLER